MPFSPSTEASDDLPPQLRKNIAISQGMDSSAATGGIVDSDMCREIRGEYERLSTSQLVARYPVSKTTIQKHVRGDCRHVLE